MIARIRPDRTSPLPMLGLSFAVLLPSLATSIANAALPALAQAFGASFAAAQWVILSYLLAVTMLTVIVGRLGDLVGRRRLLLVGMATFAAASLLCAVAPSMAGLLVARVVQGAGAAIMLTLAIAFVGDIVPRERSGSAMGLLGTMSAAGTMLGPTLGGVLIAWGSWQAIFLIHVPLAIAALLLAWRTLPPDAAPARTSRDFDGAGMLLLGTALASYALAMTMGRGRFGAANVALLIASAMALAALLRTERRVSAPLIPIAELRDRRLMAGLAASALVATVMMTTLIVGPFYLSRSLGLGPAMMGLLLSAGPLAAALAGIPAGRLVDRFGAARAGSAGLIGIAAGAAALALMPMAGGVAAYLASIMLMTIGYAVFQAANNSALMAGAPHERRGLRSGLIGLSRNLGLLTGTAAMGALFLFGTGTADIMAAAPDAVAAGMRLTLPSRPDWS
ncbi:MFS transporter [Rhizorhabdus dicambivorans]|uniref:MFS transporter n=1 Tax=Rhizorhabdus dicambivorans TaxID=1850238 RepID=UPI000A649C87|nr:MFS transporter [Rhizorhabdus dicambivorans]